MSPEKTVQVPIVMPQMGQSVAEGVILAWRKKVGEEINADEILLEIETDKTSVEVESPYPGRLASCLKQAGEVASAGEIIGMLETKEHVEEIDMKHPVEQKNAHQPHAGAHDEAVMVSAKNFRALTEPHLPNITRDYYSPAVLRLAMNNNVSLPELESISGTGKGGRITRNDVLNFLARRPVGPSSIDVISETGQIRQDELASLGKVVPMNSIRRTIADHMVQSIRTSAHVTMVHAVDMTHIVDLRSKVQDRFLRQHKAKMTYTAVMLFVTSRVLKGFPMVNASVIGTTIIQLKNINIGCAVALSDESLVVPVVQNSDKKSFPEIAKDLVRLIAIARKKGLTRADIEGGTFTISNFGAFGSLIGTPIINQPQVAILGMGAVFKAPVVVNDEIVVRDQMYLSFS
ncbi:2-oxo acid dehydrogenase subunit E2, partial [PVC group bacterium]|nr:2-oxo acid dehydrogenase subunit E2 [PVC group bacterium]